MTTLNAEYAAAVARLDADLVIAAADANVAKREIQVLRQRVLEAYRSALDRAAGTPADPRWHVLAITVGTFIARVYGNARSRDAAAAIDRLWLLRLEFLPELPREFRRVARQQIA